MDLEQLRIHARKTALVHEMALQLSEFGRKDITLASLCENKLKHFTEEENGIAVTSDEAEVILDELTNRTFLSKSTITPHTYMVQNR